MLPVQNNDQVRRYSRLAGLPQSRSVTNCLSAGPALLAGGVEADGRARLRPVTPPELDACCRSNMVTARTRFFEEKSRSSSPATPPQRRSRSATRDDDRRPRWNPDRGGSPLTPRTVSRLPPSRPTHAVSTTAVHRLGLPATVSMPVPGSTPLVNNNAGVKNETDELKV